jgi:hypothetical protein
MYTAATRWSGVTAQQHRAGRQGSAPPASCCALNPGRPRHAARLLLAPRCAPVDAGGDAASVTTEPSDDDVLPNSLFDAVQQAGATTAAAIRGGNPRCLVEISVAELFDSSSGNIMAQEGDQLRVWELCRFFVESLSQNLGVATEDGATVRAVFPDAGCAAGLAARWAGGAVSFSLSSLNDRSICTPGDVAVVVCAPDPQGVEASQRVAAEAAELGTAVVLLNPRLASGDAGIGLTARRLRDRFVGGFTVAYSIRPVADGTVFKAYPGMYQVFGADPQRPGRFKLLSEEVARPSLEDVLLTLDNGAGASGGQEGAVGVGAVAENLQRTVASMMRFMKSL